MKLIRKSSWFRRATIEMSEIEYHAYLTGKLNGIGQGFLLGVLCALLVLLIARL